MSEEGQATKPQQEDGPSAITVLVVGMAGSGKTTFMQVLRIYFYFTK